MLIEHFLALFSTFQSQIFLLFISLSSIGTSYILWKLVVRPLMRMQFYRNQGVPCYYFPILGHFKRLLSGIKEHDDFIHLHKVQARTEPSRLICTNIGSNASIFLHDPALVKEYYLNTDNYIKDPIYLDMFSAILGKGLITSEGNQWKTQRKILSSAFHFEFLKSIIPNVQTTAHQNLYNLRNTSLKNVNVMDELQKTTGEVVGKVFFGEQLNDYTFEGKPLTLGLADLMVDISKLNNTLQRSILGTWFIQKGFIPSHKRLMDRIRGFRNICHEIVETRKKSSSHAKEGKSNNDNKQKDMLELLLEYSGEEGKMSDVEIVDQFVSFFLAGMDTTGHLLTMVVYYLDKYPEYKAKMIEEVKKYYNPTQTVTIEDLNKLEFTMGFIKETLRLMTPVIGVFPRKAIKDHKLKDINIRKGDIMNLNYFYNSYNPTYFTEVDKFDPTRWLDKSKNIDAYAFTPFSAGARNCIGQHLALNESRIILGELLTMYDFSLKEGYKLRMASPFLYEPLDPILVNLSFKQ